METIRRAATALVLEHGLDHVTVEMIAEEAGISLRTFFNYFAYKEETLIPPPLGFPPEAAERFISGRGPLLTDLEYLLGERLAEMEPDRAAIRTIMTIADAHPRLQSVREYTFRQYEAEFRTLLGCRLDLPPDHQTPTLMAAVISASFRVAMCRWIEEESCSMAETLRNVMSHLPTLFGDALS